MLRYHAPFDDFDGHLKWLLGICRSCRIAEVIFIIDPEERFFGLPSLLRLRRWARLLGPAGEILRRRGIIMSINPWVTLGHGGRGYPPDVSIGLTTRMTGDDGTVSADTACPADPAWQRYICQAYAILAGARPDILWLEDDFRLHNHNEVRFGCFAAPMLDEFARRTGKCWRREELVKAIVRGDRMARKRWLQFTGDLWIENVTSIRRAVHGVNPNVKLAQMTSGMAAHSAEGRRWDEYLAAMAGPHRPITRPHFGPYRNTTGFDFVEGLTLFRHGLAFAGRQTRCCPEIENWPYSYFSKSRRQTTLSLELAQFFGCSDVTLNLFSMLGNDPRQEPWIPESLHAARERMDALAAMNLHRRNEQGVHVWTRQDASLHQKTDANASSLLSLYSSFDAWAGILSRLSVASTFQTPGALTAVCGDTIRAADRAEVLRLLSGGLLLDGRAARALQEMGYGRYLGVEVGQSSALLQPPRLITMERIVDPALASYSSPRMGCTLMGHNWSDCRAYPMTRMRGARAVSDFEDARRKRVRPAVTLYENALGGRVAAFAYDFDSGVPNSVRFYSHVRKRQLHAVLRWLNKDRPILASADPAMLLLEQCSVDDVQLIVVVNLSGDPVNGFTFSARHRPRKASILSRLGRWTRRVSITQTRDQTHVVLPAALTTLESCFIKWRRDESDAQTS